MLVLATFLVSGVLLAVASMPRIAYADPFTFVAAAATCTLPDGSSGFTTKYPNTDNTTCCPPGKTDAVSCLYAKYLNPLIALLAAVVGVVVVIGIVYGAIEYITSNGDPQRAASGKKRIINALVALVAFLLLYAFLQFIVPGGLVNG